MPALVANGQEALYTFVYNSSGGARPSPQDIGDCDSTEVAIRVRIANLTASTATLGFTAPIGTPTAQFDWECNDGDGSGSGGSGTGTTGDPTPIIDSVSPNPIPAGAQTLTINGEYFGNASGQLNIGGACTQSGDPNWSPAGDSISVSVSVDATLSSYCTVVVGASVDDSGNSFQPGGGSSQNSDPFVVSVEQPAPQQPVLAIQQGGSQGSVIAAGTTVSVLIGQRNVLYGSVVSAAGCTATSYTWTIPGNTASGWSNSTSALTPAAGITMPTVNFAWTDDQIKTVTVEFTVGLSNCAYESATATAQFSISAPTFLMNVLPTTVTSSVNVGQNSYVQAYKGLWGLYFNSSDGNTPGINFVASTNPGNNYEWVQVVNSNLIERFNLGTNQWESESVIPGQGGPVLDGTALIGSAQGFAVTMGLDWPGVFWGNSTCCSYWARADSFSTVLMFQPSSKDVWAPLYQVNWNWQGSAMLTGNNWAPWNAPVPAWIQNPSFSRTYAYPSWTQLANPNNLAFTAEAAPTVASVAISPTNVASGSSATVTVTLSSRAPSGGAQIALSSTNASLLNPGTTILIPANQLAGTVSATAGPAAGPVTVTGSYNGSQASGSVTVTPPGQ